MIAESFAMEHGVKTIAFPAISTGVYGYLIEAAARIAVSTVAEFRASHPNAPEAIFCCFSERDLGVYQRLLSEHGGGER